ncbi:MAG: UDP-N-acetylmuramate dehydrogenase [Prevotellaceae bacterium]|jgi:UDP-N-acetylmuramate dehydrogenase|nr:UDP-N-acetylmuramate dehydrogenase [Prevotellaceae bacterium]
MIVEKQHQSLLLLNTFGFDVYADHFVQADTLEDLIKVVEKDYFRNGKKIILGGGSNLLFISDFNGCVVQPALSSIDVVEENGQEVYLNVGAGVVWDNFVEYCVSKGYYGVENLSLIPGNVGASPVQNIGAYGVEAKDCIHNVKFINTINGKIEHIDNKDCRFGYRDSIFKHELKNKVIITNVIYRLEKQEKFITTYGNMEEEIKKTGNINLLSIRQAIINIRENKLPNPSVVGNAGSFFKNPFISQEQAQELKNIHPSLTLYPCTEGVKIPAGWLIEQCGFKGIKRGNIGVHPKHALVLVNYGGGTGKEVFALANEIVSMVKEKFGIVLEMEVNVVS